MTRPATVCKRACAADTLPAASSESPSCRLRRAVCVSLATAPLAATATLCRLTSRGAIGTARSYAAMVSTARSVNSGAWRSASPRLPRVRNRCAASCSPLGPGGGVDRERDRDELHDPQRWLRRVGHVYSPRGSAYHYAGILVESVLGSEGRTPRRASAGRPPPPPHAARACMQRDGGRVSAAG